MENLYSSYQPPSSSGGAYLKFEDGKQVRLRIVSEPVISDSSYEDQATGEVRVSTKYSWAIFNLDTNEAQVMTLPVTAYRLIAAYAADEDWGDPQGYILKITRTGKGKDTQYSIVATAAKEDLSEEAKLEAKALDLIALVEAGKGTSKVQWLRDVVTKGRTTVDTKKRDSLVADFTDEPINLDDIPFS